MVEIRVPFQSCYNGLQSILNIVGWAWGQLSGGMIYYENLVVLTHWDKMGHHSYMTYLNAFSWKKTDLLYPYPIGGGYTGFTLSVFPSVCPSVHPPVDGFKCLTQVCFGISISNFMCMYYVAMGNTLLIFNDVTFKMAVQTSVVNYSCKWKEANSFSAMSLSKCPPGSHIEFYSFWILTSTWLWKSNPNFRSTLPVCIGREKAKWFWTMFNCNPHIAHCYLSSWCPGRSLIYNF